MSVPQLDKSLKKIEYLFRWSGVNLESNKNTAKDNRKITLFYIFNMIWMETDIFAGIWWIIKHSMRGASFAEMLYVVPCTLYFFLSNIKSITFFIHDRQVNEVISILREAEKHFNEPNDAGKDEIVKNETNFLNLMLTILNFYNWISCVSFLLMPLVYMSIKYYRTNEIELMLPQIVEYPFDVFDRSIYPFVYLRQVWTTTVVLLQLASIDFFFYICTSYIKLQFKLLRHDIERSLNDSEHDAELFVQLVNWHQELFHCVNVLEILYSKSTLYNFLASSIMTCMCVFNILTIDDVPFKISFVCFLIMSVYQIFFLCFLGDMMMTSAMEVCDGAYNSNWYQASASVGKQINIIQTRARAPCKLTAYGFANVNLEAFTKILSTSYSYFALLQRLYGTDRG